MNEVVVGRIEEYLNSKRQAYVVLYMASERWECCRQYSMKIYFLLKSSKKRKYAEVALFEKVTSHTNKLC